MAVDAMTKKGMPKAEAQSIAAKEGRAKYGKEQFAKFAAEGRKRSSKKK
jgi:hypothetical protein